MQILIFTMCLFFTGCAGMLTHRSFIDEMDNADTSLFNPHDDFPVVSGDASSGVPSMQDIMRRTPASLNEQKQSREKAALAQELRNLEEGQTTEMYYHYLEYRDKLPLTSEKIYFLRLKGLKARNEYLYGKGLYDLGKAPSVAVKEAISNREIVVGMEKEDVVSSWGRPSRVDVAGDPDRENERWSFYYRGRLKQVFFEGGRVQGWDQQ